MNFVSVVWRFIVLSTAYYEQQEALSRYLHKTHLVLAYILMKLGGKE